MLSSTPRTFVGSTTFTVDRMTCDHCRRAVTDETPAAHRLSGKRFTVHFLEMVVAMAVGMVVLHPVWMFLLDASGAAWLMSNPYTGGLVMATNMTVAMSAWMRFRGHRWQPIAEMGLAMY